jgi:hypothetical protein
MAYGSVVNMLASQSRKAPDAHVGDGVTFIYWSDRNCGTVEKILTPNRCVVRRDAVQWNADGTARVVARDVEGVQSTLIRTKRGWKVMGESTRVQMGVRDPYTDPNF